MFKAQKGMYRLYSKGIRIVLALAVCLINVIPSSYAAFQSDGKAAFSASVTIGGVDNDYDGIPDSWEATHGLDSSDPDDASYDNDNDGITNLEEYRMGTDPITSNSGITITASALFAGGSIVPADVTFTATVGDNGGADIVKYEWDFDGNGTYDQWHYASEVSSINTDSVSYIYTASGNYDVKVRVTNVDGKTAVAHVQNFNVTTSASAPLANTEFSLIAGSDGNGIDIPETVYLNASPTGSNGIVLYEWDTTGNGEYDTSSTNASNIIKTYNKTKSGSINASFKVTDTTGLANIGVVGIVTDASMWNDSTSRPVITLGEYIIDNVTLGNAVTLGVSGEATVAGGSAYGYTRKIEWDFETDGVNDFSATSTLGVNWNQYAPIEATKTYGAPGIYRATVTSHTEAELSTDESVLVIVSGTEPSLRALGSETYLSTQGLVPLKVEFDHSSSTGAITKYEWDFNGDKKIDYTTTNSSDKPIHTYQDPGYHVAMLQITDSNGHIDTDYIPIFIAYPISSHTGNIKLPSDGQTIAGNYLMLSAEIYPDNVTTADIKFQYSPSGQGIWTDITDGAITTTLSYSTPWDTTNVTGGDYDLRAIVIGDNASLFETITVTVDNTGATTDINENRNGNHEKTVTVDPDQSNTIVMPDGTQIEIPQGAVPGTAGPTITVTQVIDAGIGEISLTVTGIEEFLQDVTITMYYPDENNDGIVDGTNIDETTLKVVWFDDNGDQVPLYNSIVHPDENFVTAQTNHFSGIGLIGAIIGGAAAGSGSSSSGGSTASYCFIATAAYGTPQADDVMVLRDFRDKYLLRSNIGRGFVWNYYRYSPSIAKFIKDKPVLKRIVRSILKPLVKFAKERV